ncbi:MAG: hypothetical protein GY772_28280 [bacterium]|nr:hypothetical protein [bacterium]
MSVSTQNKVQYNAESFQKEVVADVAAEEEGTAAGQKERGAMGQNHSKKKL